MARGNPGRASKLVLTVCKELFNFERGLERSLRYSRTWGISSTFVRSLKFKVKFCQGRCFQIQTKFEKFFPCMCVPAGNMLYGVLRALTWRMGSQDFQVQLLYTSCVSYSLFMAFIILMSSITCASHKTSHETWLSISYTSFVAFSFVTYVMYRVLIVDLLHPVDCKLATWKSQGKCFHVLVSTTYYHQYGMTLWVTNESPYEPTLEREVPMAMSPFHLAKGGNKREGEGRVRVQGLDESSQKPWFKLMNSSKCFLDLDEIPRSLVPKRKSRIQFNFIVPISLDKGNNMYVRRQVQGLALVQPKVERKLGLFAIVVLTFFETICAICTNILQQQVSMIVN